MNFSEQCYELLMQVPKGKVTTYKEIANALGTKAYRAVGSAMNKNPNPVIVPCHRVVKTDGTLGGYAYGDKKKIALLKEEGVAVKDGKIVNFTTTLHHFS